MTIALVSDQDGFAHEIVARSRLAIRPLSEPPTLADVAGEPPFDYFLEGDPLEAVIVDAHLVCGSDGRNPGSARQWHRGVEWFGEFRSKGYRTPALLLTWDQAQSSKRWLQSNPFVGALCRDSCATLRLPVAIEKIKAVLQSLTPITAPTWLDCMRQLRLGLIEHKLINISRMEVRDGKDHLQRLFSDQVVYHERIQEIVKIKDADEFRRAIQELWKSLSGR